MEDKKMNIKFTDIIGYEIEKNSLKEKVIMPILYPLLFQSKRAL
jgi:SpoVK/Ycf46/Vps4 family AAA+-type ATPase